MPQDPLTRRNPPARKAKGRLPGAGLDDAYKVPQTHFYANDFEAMQQLEEATGCTAPASLSALRQKAERFHTVIDPEQIAQVALRYQA